MKPLLLALGLVLVGVTTLYWTRPRLLFDVVKGLLRRRAALSRKSVRVGDSEWPYLDGGKATGDPVVLVHGFGGDKDNWTLYAPYLAPHHRVICPDLPGFGENDHSVDRDYRMQAQAWRLRDFLDALGVARCHLAGNSMGGFIALQFALDFPGRVASLTLLDNAGVAGTGSSDLQRAIERRENPLELKTLADVDRLFAFVYHKPPFMPRQFKRVLLGDALANERVLEKVFWTLADEGIAGVLNARLGEVRVPTLIVWGRQDQLIDVSVVDELRRGIPDSVAVIFEHVGHVPMLEAPQETAEHHLALLARASGVADHALAGLR
ncbi:MAG: alpha/beta fold hydrolase [Steroidobacteraceae bacterium]